MRQLMCTRSTNTASSMPPVSCYRLCAALLWTPVFPCFAMNVAYPDAILQGLCIIIGLFLGDARLKHCPYNPLDILNSLRFTQDDEDRRFPGSGCTDCRRGRSTG